jgi:chloramphenicol-sensitive protein RarD
VKNTEIGPSSGSLRAIFFRTGVAAIVADRVRHFSGASYRPEQRGVVASDPTRQSEDGMASPDDHDATLSRAGVLYAIGAYGLWGVVPIYWKWLADLPALELVGPRVVWSAILLVTWLVVARRGREIAIPERRLIVPVLVAALLIAVNWLIFIHAVQTDQIIATSLGYYINPLVSVFLGLVVLGERLRPLQTFAVVIACVGVAAYALRVGSLPWISVVLAVSFGLYGLVHKMNPQPPVPGLAREMLVLLPLAAGVQGWLVLEGSSELFGASLGVHAVVALSGVVTVAPLLCFRSATARLPLVAVGMFQYIGPTLTLVIAVVLYGEAFTRDHAMTFGCVWLALALFTLDAVRAGRRSSRRVAASETA